MSHDIPLTRAEFDRALDALRRQVQADPANPASYQSDSSTRCFGCMFTTESSDCFHCTYCHQCRDCSDCTHCTRALNCHASSYCVDATSCHKCTYVLLSSHCYECVFCFGCVGLVKKEFYILNRPFKRQVYFKIVAELKAAYGLK